MQDDNPVPGFVAEPELQAKLDNLDDKLEPIVVEEPKKNEPAESKEDPKDDDAGEEAKETDEPAEESNDSADSEGDEEVSEAEDEGYTIDGDDESPAEDDKKPEEKVENAPERSQLTPEQQYIIDNVSPITVRGTVGADEKVQEFKVYAPEQLPDGFKYVDDKSSSAANQAFGQLENRAKELQADFRSQESKKAADAFKVAEDNADRADIGRLQRNGEIPRFKLKPNDPGFTEDPASKLIQEVLDFKEKKNTEYLEAANAGRPYRHIGFEEAFLMYRRENPVKSDPAQVKEDSDRKNLARRTSGTKGATSGDSLKPRVHSGMGSMDLERLIETKTSDWN